MVRYQELPADARLALWERAQLREQRLNPAERAARDQALVEARGRRSVRARFVGGPWDGREEPVELAAHGGLPAEYTVTGAAPAVAGGAPVAVPAPHRYRLGGIIRDFGTPVYVSEEDDGTGLKNGG